jgi:hypothetical protein
VDAAAEWRQDGDAPVAEIVARSFNHDGAVVGHGAGGAELFVEIGDQIRGGFRVEPVLALERRDRVGGFRLAQLANELADRHAEFDGPPRPLALPERHLSRLAWRG